MKIPIYKNSIFSHGQEFLKRKKKIKLQLILYFECVSWIKKEIKVFKVRSFKKMF